jgi:hypothetical protein
MFLCLINLYNSSFVLILHVLSLPFRHTYILWFIFKQKQFIFFTNILNNTKNVICYFSLTMQNLTKTNDQSTQLYFIRMTLHVWDHSIHHQVYTDSKFIGKCAYIKMPSPYLWDTTRLQKNVLLFLALQSLVDFSLFHNCPLLFLVPRLTSPGPYTCKSLFILGCLHYFLPLSSFRRFSRYIFLRGGVFCLMPNPQPGGPRYPVLSGSSPWPVWHGRPYQ